MVGDILQPTHLLFVLVVALLVLGPKRLPEVGRTLGNGIRDFRSAINGESTESKDEIESESKPWHSDPEPEQKHEFAHDGETTPESHEFAHEVPAVSPTAPPQTVPSPAAPAAAAPVAAAQPVDAQPVEAPAQPAATSDTAAAPDKHEFAYEASEAAENSAGPRT